MFGIGIIAGMLGITGTFAMEDAVAIVGNITSLIFAVAAFSNSFFGSNSFKRLSFFNGFIAGSMPFLFKFLFTSCATISNFSI